IAATAFSLTQMREAQRQRDESLHDAKLSGAMSAIQALLAGDSRGADGKALDLDGRIALAERVLRRQFGNDPWLVAQLMTELAGRFYEAGENEAERRMLARTLDMARAAKLPAQVALAACRRVRNYTFEDKFDSARADLAEAKAALTRAGRRVDPSI